MKFNLKWLNVIMKIITVLPVIKAGIEKLIQDVRDAEKDFKGI